MNQRKTPICKSSGFRLEVEKLTEEERKAILSACKKLGMRKPRFYKQAILDKVEATNGTSDTL